MCQICFWKVEFHLICLNHPYPHLCQLRTNRRFSKILFIPKPQVIALPPTNLTILLVELIERTSNKTVDPKSANNRPFHAEIGWVIINGNIIYNNILLFFISFLIFLREKSKWEHIENEAYNTCGEYEDSPELAINQTSKQVYLCVTSQAEWETKNDNDANKTS